MKTHGKKVHQENRGYLMTWKEKGMKTGGTVQKQFFGFQIRIMVTSRNKDKSFDLLCTPVEIYVR